MNSEEYKTKNFFIIEEGRRIDAIMTEASALGPKVHDLLLRVMSAEQHAKWQTYLACERVDNQENINEKKYFKLARQLKDLLFNKMNDEPIQKGPNS